MPAACLNPVTVEMRLGTQPVVEVCCMNDETKMILQQLTASKQGEAVGSPGNGDEEWAANVPLPQSGMNGIQNRIGGERRHRECVRCWG